MLRPKMSAPNRDEPQDGQVARRLKEITPGVARLSAVTLSWRFTISAFSRMIGLGTGAPVSFSTTADHPSSEKVVTKLKDASRLPMFCKRTGISPDSPGNKVSASSGVCEVRDTPYCSVTARFIVTLPFSPELVPPLSWNQTCQVCCCTSAPAGMLMLT